MSPVGPVDSQNDVNIWENHGKTKSKVVRLVRLVRKVYRKVIYFPSFSIIFHIGVWRDTCRMQEPPGTPGTPSDFSGESISMETANKNGPWITWILPKLERRAGLFTWRSRAELLRHASLVHEIDRNRLSFWPFSVAHWAAQNLLF